MAKLSIKLLDERVIAVTFTPFDCQTSWIMDVVARHFDCDAEDVGFEETEDGEDLITVHGVPSAKAEKTFGLQGSF